MSARSQRALPPVVVALGAVLEGEPADDQADQDQQQRQVEAAEEGGVPLREGGEGRAAGDQHPHLVAVPDRADGVDHDPPLGVVAGEHGQEHADAEVEALQAEVADPEDGDQANQTVVSSMSILYQWSSGAASVGEGERGVVVVTRRLGTSGGSTKGSAPFFA